MNVNNYGLIEISHKTEDEIEEALYEEYKNSPQYEVDMEKQYQEHKDRIDAKIAQSEYPQDYK